MITKEITHHLQTIYTLKHQAKQQQKAIQDLKNRISHGCYSVTFTGLYGSPNVNIQVTSN